MPDALLGTPLKRKENKIKVSTLSTTYIFLYWLCISSNFTLSKAHQGKSFESMNLNIKKNLLKFCKCTDTKHFGKIPKTNQWISTANSKIPTRTITKTIITEIGKVCNNEVWHVIWYFLPLPRNEILGLKNQIQLVMKWISFEINYLFSADLMMYVSEDE